MATSVKQRYEGWSSNVVQSSGWEVTVPYIVIGPDNVSDVHSAEDDDTGLAVPLKGSFYPNSTYLVCDEVRVEWIDQAVDGDTWHVDAVYRSPTWEGQDFPRDEYQWGEAVRTIEVYCDRNGRPFLNSAADPLIGAFPYEIYEPYLEVWRTVPVFDPAFANLIRGKVNSTQINLFGQWIVPPQNMRLTSYRPMNTFAAGQILSSARIYHRFDFRFGYRGFQPRAIDQGFNAWYTSFKGAIYPNESNEPTQVPVLLGGNGIPINSSAYVIRAEPGGTANPITPPPINVDNFTIDPASNVPESSGRVLVWEVYGTYDFNGLVPGIM